MNSPSLSTLAEAEAPGITFIVAVARNGVIGRAGELPWRLPGDIRRFRDRTMGRPVLMGRKTFEAIGRPLQGRETIVLTRNDAFAPSGVHVVRTLAAALGCAHERARAMNVPEAIVAGGADVYAALLPFATEMHLTEVASEPDGDALFPELPPSMWQEASRQEFPVGAPDPLACTVRVLRKREESAPGH